jgi:uncharacterized membrane protein YoaK (UPF0700 family)
MSPVELFNAVLPIIGFVVGVLLERHYKPRRCTKCEEARRTSEEG